MASLKGSKGKKRCTKGKSCGASCIQMRKVCWKEMGDGVSSSASKVRDMIKPSGKEQPKKPDLKIPKDLKLPSPILPGDERFLPKLQYGWGGGPPGAYEAWLKRHDDRVREEARRLGEIRATERRLGKKYSDNRIENLLDYKRQLEYVDKVIKDPKTNPDYLNSFVKNKKELERKIKSLEED